MSSYRNQKVMAALEEAELQGAGVAEELVPAAAAEVEAAAADIGGEMTQIDEMNAVAADGEGEVEALTDVQDLMQEAVDSGEGMSEQTAEMAEVAVERILDKLGFARGSSNLPGLESFGNKGSRLSSTKLALEAVSDSLKKAGAGLIAFLKQIWEKLKSFLAGLIKSKEVLGKNLAALQKRAGELKGSKKKSETIKSGAAKALSVDGKADETTAATVLAESAKLVDVSMNISTILSKEAASFNVSKEGQLGEIVKGITSNLAKLSVVKPEKAKDGHSYFGHLVGGKSVGITTSAGEGKDKLGMSIEQVGKLAEDAKALSAEEVVALLGNADAALKTLVNFAKVDKELQATTKAALNYLEKLGNQNTAAVNSGEKGDEAGAGVTKLIAEMREVANIASKVGLSFPGMVFNAVKAATDYASASLNNLTSEEAPAKAEGDKPAKK